MWFAQALVVAALAACQTTDTRQPIRSPLDDREYRHVKLSNNLRALLIHAPGSDSAAAAASVARGSDHDPDAHEGLAHFVEHMLFIATEKYPKVDGFTDFVLKHGGSYRAYTGNDRTTYYFHLQADRFPEALDRFAQFFIAPLFDPDYVEREKESIQSEYELQGKQDEWRGFAVAQQLFAPAHPSSRFNIGSLETLHGVGVQEVRAFFNANYSADTITVAVFGPQDLDQLESLVSKQFGDVIDRGLGPRPANPPLYSPKTLPASYAWRSIKNAQSIGFTFPVPPLKPHYRTKPAQYLARLVGHEGPDSLHDVLSRHGWISWLSAGDYTTDDQNSLLHIEIELTDSGALHIEEIVDLTYAWIDLIRREGIAAWRHREHARLANLSFRFRDPTTPVAAVIDAAEAVADYPPNDVLRHSYVMERFDEPLIRKFVRFLTPENALVSISGPDIEGDRIEPVFGTVWRPGPAMLPRHVDSQFQLPGPNPYVAEDFQLALEPNPPVKPVLLATKTAVETWHAPDAEFLLPTARLDLQLRAAEPFTPVDVVLATLHTKLVEEAMNARTYSARLAGLAHSVDPTWTGMRIYVSGYHDNLAILFEDVLDTFVDPAFDADRFAVARNELAKTYANQKLRRPHEQLAQTLYRLIHPSMWPTDALLNAVRRVTPETLSAWRKRRFANMGATFLVHGNLLEDDARSLAALVQTRLGIVELPHVLPKARHLDVSRRYEHSVEHDDAAYALYIQGESDSIEERARIGLIGKMLSVRYFTALRTERQLGYVVHAYALSIARHPGIACVVQASKAGAEEIETLTQTFLDEQPAWFRGLSDAQLDEYKNGYIASLTRADRNNHDRVSRLVTDLAARVLTFDQRDQLAEAVRRLTPAEVADAYDALIDPARGNRLTVYSPGQAGTAPQDGTPVSSINGLKVSTARQFSPRTSSTYSANGIIPISLRRESTFASSSIGNSSSLPVSSSQ